MNKRLAAFAGTVRRMVGRLLCTHAVCMVSADALRPDMAGNVYPAVCKRCGHLQYVTAAAVQADAMRGTRLFDSPNAHIEGFGALATNTLRCVVLLLLCSCPRCHNHTKVGKNVREYWDRETSASVVHQFPRK